MWKCRWPGPSEILIPALLNQGWLASRCGSIVLWIFFSLSLHCWFPKDALVHVCTSKYCSLLRVLVYWIRTPCQARGGSALTSTNTPEKLYDCECVLAHAVTCWMPGLQRPPQSPLSLLFSLAAVCFRPALFVQDSFLIAPQMFESFIFVWVCSWEWTNHENIIPSSGWRDETVDPCNDGFAPCFVMIGGFGYTCCAIAEKLLSHVSHDFTLCNYIYV